MSLITFCRALSNSLISLYSPNKHFAVRFSPCPNLRTDCVCLAGTDERRLKTTRLAVDTLNSWKMTFRKIPLTPPNQTFKPQCSWLMFKVSQLWQGDNTSSSTDGTELINFIGLKKNRLIDFTLSLQPEYWLISQIDWMNPVYITNVKTISFVLLVSVEKISNSLKLLVRLSVWFQWDDDPRACLCSS